MDAAVLMAWMDLTADARVALLWELRLAIAGHMLRFGLTLAPLFSCDLARPLPILGGTVLACLRNNGPPAPHSSQCPLDGAVAPLWARAGLTVAPTLVTRAVESLSGTDRLFTAL